MKTSIDIEKAKQQLLAEEEMEKSITVISRAEAQEMIKDSMDLIYMCFETFEDEVRVMRNEKAKAKWDILNKKFKALKKRNIVISNE